MKPKRQTKRAAGIKPPKFPFLCKVLGHEIYDAGNCLFHPTKDCMKCQLTFSLPIPFGNWSPTPEKSKEIRAKKVDKRTERKSEKQFIYHFGEIKITIFAYIELLRRLYSGTPLTVANLATLKKVENYLEGLKRDWVQKFLTECAAEETRLVSVAVDGLGPYAFTQEWFNKGLAILLSKGKIVQLRPWPEEGDFTEFIRQMAEVEKTLAKSNSLDAFGKENESAYYDKLPRTLEILIVHMVFGLSDLSFHSHFINFYPPFKDPETLFQFCNKNLP